MRRMILICCAALAALIPAFRPTADAAEPGVFTALVIEIDVSDSVSKTRFEIQREGYAAAFASSKVIKILSAEPAEIAVVVWAGCQDAYPVIPWQIVSDEASSLALSVQFMALKRPFEGMTCPANALRFGAKLFDSAPEQVGHRVIDISGDGPANQPKITVKKDYAYSARKTREARDAAAAEGIMINGLPLILPPGSEYATWRHSGIRLPAYYRQNIQSPNGFVIAVKDANSRSAFAHAVKEKLLRELPMFISERGGRLFNLN